MNWIEKRIHDLFGPLEADVKAKVIAAFQAGLEAGKIAGESELTAVMVSRVNTARPDTEAAGKVYLAAIGELGK